MRKGLFLTIMMSILLLIGIAHPSKAAAGVDINIGINISPPPPLVISAPPPVLVIPETYVYFPPEVDIDIFFYNGYWYRPHQGHWYRSGRYSGKWAYISPRYVPSVLIKLPPDFRRVPPGHRHIPYGHLKKNWKSWQREKYWEKHGYRYEEREDRKHRGREGGNHRRSRGRHND